MYLLDTNICITLLNTRHSQVEQKMREIGPAKIALCSIVKAELLFGARHSARVEKNLQNLDRFFAPFASYPFDDHCAQEYGSIRAHLAREGNLVGPNDLLIAATARANDLVLVTNNTREFVRVPGLRVESWLG